MRTQESPRRRSRTRPTRRTRLVARWSALLAAALLALAGPASAVNGP